MQAQKRKTRREHSSGGAVISVFEGSLYVAMISTRGGSRWGLPKGAVMDGETSEQAAIREVSEETGLHAAVLEPIETIEYFFRAGDTIIQKNVDFYMMGYTGGSIRPQLSEVDDAVWVGLEEAINRVSFDSEKRVLLQVREAWSHLQGDVRQRFLRV